MAVVFVCHPDARAVPTAPTYELFWEKQTLNPALRVVLQQLDAIVPPCCLLASCYEAIPTETHWAYQPGPMHWHRLVPRGVWDGIF